MLKIDIISVQPAMFSGFLSESIVARAVKKGLCEVNVVDLRAFGLGKWKKTDDTPYGGGPGMLMRCEPWFAAVESCLGTGVEIQPSTFNLQPSTRIIMTSPAGKTFTQRDAEMFARLATSSSPSTSPSPSNLHLIFLCGHYEGFDARIETLVTDKYSIGDFVMTGGELAAAAMTDAIVRLLPGALGGGAAATSNESFSLCYATGDGNSQLSTLNSGPLLEAPQYTHPPEFRGMKVPEVLLSGDHRKIEAWRRAEALRLTQAARPDLME